ncbi:MAG: hypothetical protein LCH63_10165 [Candidatus Melainabacteria bacterium]|nr:hypothetical protein [Candidatus Melainabacteria bacterium]
MPKPLPSYVPAEIAFEIEQRGLSGLADFAISKGLPRHRLHALFGTSRHPKLRPFFNLTRFAGISMDAFYKEVTRGKFPELIEKILWTKQIKNISELERLADVGRDTLRARLDDKYTSWDMIEGYAETAAALDWSFEKLCRVMFSNAGKAKAS